jgi:hypothetical protein
MTNTPILIVKGDPDIYPAKFRCSTKFVQELAACEEGLYEDVCAEREALANETEPGQVAQRVFGVPVVGDFIHRYKSQIEVRNSAELEALEWALTSGTTSMYMPSAVDRLLYKIACFKNGESYEVKKRKLFRQGDPRRMFVEGVNIPKTYRAIARMLERNVQDIVPPSVSPQVDLQNVPLTIRRKDRNCSSGYCRYGQGISVTLGLELSDALHVIIHELCHALLGYGYGHGRVFKALQRNAHEVFNESKYRTDNNLPLAVLR